MKGAMPVLGGVVGGTTLPLLLAVEIVQGDVYSRTHRKSVHSEFLVYCCGCAMFPVTSLTARRS